MAAGLIAGLSACAPEEPDAQSPVSTDRRVRTATVAPAPALAEYAFPGVTRAAERGTLAFQVAGQLQTRAAIGQSFKAGDALATLSNPSAEPAANAARQRLAQLRAERAQAERDVARAENLLAKGAATSEEVERSRAGLDALRAGEQAARAQLAQAERFQSETRLIAPFSGSVSQVFFEPGEFVSPGQPVLSASGGQGMEVEITLPEAIALNTTTGQALRVRLPFVDRRLTGRVSQVASAAPATGRLFPVVVSIPADGLRPGLTAEVLIPNPRSAELTVPLRAVVDPGGNAPRVFKLQDGVAQRVAIDIGDIIGERVIVTGGTLARGDQVITSGVSRMVDGEAVTVAQ